MRTKPEEEAGRQRPLSTHAEQHYWNINSNYDPRIYDKAAKNIRRRCVRQTFTLQSAPIIQQKKRCFNSETKSLKHTGQNSETDYLVNHFHPFGQVVKGLQLGDVINQHNSLGTSVVG